MNEVSKYQIYALRAMYLLVVIGLSLTVWPDVFAAEKPFASWGSAQTVQTSMMGAFWLLCALGIRYPLQMLPIGTALVLYLAELSEKAGHTLG